MDQRFIELPSKAVRNLEIGDKVKVDGEQYEVKTIRRSEEGNEVELIRDERPDTVELEEEIQSEHDDLHEELPEEVAEELGLEKLE